MKKIIKLLVVIFSLLIGPNAESQVVVPSLCSNSDFSLQNFTNWTGCYCISQNWSCYTPIMNAGTIPNCIPLATAPTFNCGTSGFLLPSNPIVNIARPSLHTILTQANTSYYNAASPSLTGLYDSLTNYGLRKVPVGIGQVVRLNSWKIMYETSQLTYTMTVDTNVSGLFVYSYAAVLENPAHGCADQPYFQIRLLDTNGQLINNTYGNFTYVAGTPNTNINVCTAAGHTINWFDWQTVGLSLKAYHGQTLKIQFIAADCSAGGHFGYAYLYGNCVPRQINTKFCSGSTTAVLTAPPGFKYKWFPTGDTTKSITLNNPIVGTSYKVILKSIVYDSIYSDTLKTILTTNIVHSEFTYDRTCVNIPVNFTRTTTSNIPIYKSLWDFGDPGSSGNQQVSVVNPTHTYLMPGNYTVKLTDSLVSGCADNITKIITVSTIPQPPVIIKIGDSLISSEAIGNQWYNSVTGIVNNAISQTFIPQQNGDYFSIITLNGCSSDTSNIIHYNNTGIGTDSKFENYVSFNPNPSNGVVNFSMIGNCVANLKIIDITGSVIYDQTLQIKGVTKSSFDFSNYSKGIYFVKYTSGNDVVIKKLIIN